MPDIHDLWLKLNYWTLAHSKDLKKWWVIIFIAFDVFILVFTLTNVVVYFLTTHRDTNIILAMANDEVRYQEYREKQKPQPLTIESTQAIHAGTGQYDLVAKISNSNPNWAAPALSYTFRLGGKDVSSGEMFLLPNTDTYAAALAVPSASAPGSAEFLITGNAWQRVSDKKIIDAIDFQITEVSYTTSTTSAGNTAGNLTAKVVNQSLYGFWETRFVILLFAGTKLAGIQFAHLDQFRSFETKSLEKHWINAPVSVTRVEVIPEVNVLDQNNFMK